MEKRVRELIDKLANITNNIIFSGYKYPKGLSLEEALENVGVEVRYFNDTDLDGFLRWDRNNEKPIISVNANQAEVRRNFSMAHELGHLIIDYGWVPFSNNKNLNHGEDILNVTKYRGAHYTAEERKEEKIVDEFAAGFLIPNDKLKKMIDKTEMSDISYQGLSEQIAEKFNVSYQAASIRLDNFVDLQV